jgi:hypothetical protein
MINENILKITGGASLDREVEPSKNLLIKNGELSVYSVEKRDNQNGSFNLIYKAKFVSEIDFVQEGKPIRGADKTSKSKKLRGAIWHLSSEADMGGLDEEQFYEVVMDKIVLNLPEIWQFVKDK